MDIYKHLNQDCSAGGLSSRYEDVRIWDGFDVDAPNNAVVILRDIILGKPRIRAVPANKPEKMTMFSGCFIYTSNGVVPHHGIPIPLHDRIEYA